MPEKGMDVHFTPENQAQRARITASFARYLDAEARFLAAVEKAIAAGARGEFVDEEEIDACLEAMFNA